MTCPRALDLTERPLDVPILTFSIPELIAQLKQEETWRKGVRNSMTLLKGNGFRLVLVVCAPRRRSRRIGRTASSISASSKGRSVSKQTRKVFSYS